VDALIAKLTPEQARRVLARLFRKRRDLRTAIQTEMQHVLTEIDRDKTANQVFIVLDSIEMDEDRGRSDGPCEGRSSADNAAADLIEEALQPFFDQVERYHELGMLDEESTYCRAVILGAYRYAQDAGSELAGWPVDLVTECASLLLGQWRQRNGESRVKAMQDFIRRHCPAWAQLMERSQR
jgi:hypothetical protein